MNGKYPKSSLIQTKVSTINSKRNGENYDQNIFNLFGGLYDIKECFSEKEFSGLYEIIQNLCEGFESHYDPITYDVKINSIGKKYIEIKNNHDRVVCVIGIDITIKDVGIPTISINGSQITLSSDEYLWKGNIGEFLLYHEIDDYNKIYINESYKNINKNKDIFDIILLGYNISYENYINKIIYDKYGKSFQYLDYQNGEVTVIMDENCLITYNNHLWTEVFLVGKDRVTHIYGYNKDVYSYEEFRNDYIDIIRGNDELFVYSTNKKGEYMNIFGDLISLNYDTQDVDGFKKDDLSLQDLDEGQKKVILQLQLGKNVFVSGRAGTGKSAIIKFLQDIFPESSIVKTASTGLAAINIGGRTTPSTMRLKIFELDDLEIRKKNQDNYTISDADIIVIDEVLMYNVENMRQIDLALKSATGNNDLFGGKQIMCLGDIAQLEPFTGSNPIGSEFFKDFITIDLQKIHRQESPIFQEILERYRKNVLDSLSNESLTKDWLQHTSKHWQPGMIIADTKERADEINKLFINKLTTTEYIDVETIIEGNYTKELPYKKIRYFIGMQVMCIRNGQYGRNSYDQKISLVNGDIGTIEDIWGDSIQVYFQDKKESIWIKQISDQEYVTNTISFEDALQQEVEIYEDIYNEHFDINDDYELNQNIDNYELYKEKDIEKFISSIKPKLIELTDKEGKIRVKKIVGSASYFPLIPSYAVSVRKAQGLTLEQGVLDISVLNTTNKRLQYVGVSRFKSLENMFVTDVVEYLEGQKDILGIYTLEHANNLLLEDYSEGIAMYIYSHLEHYNKEDHIKIVELLLESNLLPLEYQKELEQRKLIITKEGT